MREAGWNPGLHDAETFICAGSAEKIVVQVDGKPIACVSGVRYDDSFGFMGCYLVREQFRGQGYGLAIHESGRAHWRVAPRAATACWRTWRNTRKSVAFTHIATLATRAAGRKNADWRQGAEVVDVRETPLSLVEELDRACFPAPRRTFLEASINRPTPMPGNSNISGHAAAARIRRYPPVLFGMEDRPAFCEGPASGGGYFLRPDTADTGWRFVCIGCCRAEHRRISPGWALWHVRSIRHGKDVHRAVSAGQSGLGVWSHNFRTWLIACPRHTDIRAYPHEKTFLKS